MDETETKVCYRCEKTKPLTEYYATKRGRRRLCKTCVYEGKLGSVKAWREAHPDRTREFSRQSRREREGKWKPLAKEALGGRCKHCGIDDLRVLQFDHVNGGGTIERSRLDRVAFYRQIAEGKRSDIQLLCANCHLVKTFPA